MLQSSEPILRFATLGLICLLAFSIRLFAVVRWESVIHEFDPQFVSGPVIAVLHSCCCITPKICVAIHTGTGGTILRS